MPTRLVLVALTAVALAPAAALSQDGPWEATLRGGVVRNDALPESDADPVLGAGAFRWSTAGLGVGVRLDWIPSDDDSFALGTGGALDIDVFDYSAEVWWAFPRASRLRFAVGAGLGGSTTRIEGELADDAVDTSETNLMVPVAGSLTILNREEAPSWGLRFEVRDDVIFAADEDPVGNARGDDVLQNLHATVGLSVFFGGTRPEFSRAARR